VPLLQGYNLCYSTLVNANDVARLPADSYEKSPSGHVFVRSSHKKGLLPQILDELLAARKRGACRLSVCLYVLCENWKAKLTLKIHGSVGILAMFAAAVFLLPSLFW
jgi:hypothetical protein